MVYTDNSLGRAFYLFDHARREYVFVDFMYWN